MAPEHPGFPVPDHRAAAHHRLPGPHPARPELGVRQHGALPRPVRPAPQGGQQRNPDLPYRQSLIGSLQPEVTYEYQVCSTNIWKNIGQILFYCDIAYGHGPCCSQALLFLTLSFKIYNRKSTQLRAEQILFRVKEFFNSVQSSCQP